MNDNILKKLIILFLKPRGLTVFSDIVAHFRGRARPRAVIIALRNLDKEGVIFSKFVKRTHADRIEFIIAYENKDT